MMREAPSPQPPSALVPSRHPPFLEALLVDARVAAIFRGERDEFRSRLDGVLQALRLMLQTDAFLALAAYRAKARLYALGVPILPWIAHRIAIVCGQISIAETAVVQPGVFIPNGQVVVRGEVEIEPLVTLLPWVTVGPIGDKLTGPRIGPGARIGTGAKVLGDVQVGASARVATNAVVLDDVPPNTTVVGMPARSASEPPSVAQPADKPPPRRDPATSRPDTTVVGMPAGSVSGPSSVAQPAGKPPPGRDSATSRTESSHMDVALEAEGPTQTGTVGGDEVTTPHRRSWLFVIVLTIMALVVLAVVSLREGANGGRAGGGEAPPLASLAAATGDAPGRHRAGWRLAWHDEFNQARCPDRAKWGFERGFVRNEELQWYQPQNASCHDGVLVIEARRADRPNPNYRPDSTDWRQSRASASYTSASMTSKAAFTYGRFEMFARIDTRQGSSPAFWTLGRAFRRNPNAWPQSGEVDIMEYDRNTVLANVCKPKRSECGWSSTRQSLPSLGGEAWANEFHLWAMEWSARKIDLFLDGKLVNHFSVGALGAGDRNPYLNKPAYLLLSQAIGGENGGDPTNTSFPIRFAVDYVRVYQRGAGGG
jgi:serine acetyltransferase/beta-glucanase (GH16 family)